MAADYRSDCLDEADAQRLAVTPALAQRQDWQVSRCLKQHAPAPLLSLSHSRGHTALLCGTNQSAGVDIETLRPRDFAALAAWICSPSEAAWLAHQGWQCEDFYRLWTLKEALLKAAGLNFPEDMAAVGLMPRKHTLHVRGKSGWYGLTAQVGAEHMLACVWRDPMIRVPQWRCYAAAQPTQIRHYG
nr:4'-phosphopantetheinyl transferase superfamily protein [Neisseria sp. HSC-16F19]